MINTEYKEFKSNNEYLIELHGMRIKNFIINDYAFLNSNYWLGML